MTIFHPWLGTPDLDKGKNTLIATCNRSRLIWTSNPTQVVKYTHQKAYSGRRDVVALLQASERKV